MGKDPAATAALYTLLAFLILSTVIVVGVIVVPLAIIGGAGWLGYKLYHVNAQKKQAEAELARIHQLTANPPAFPDAKTFTDNFIRSYYQEEELVPQSDIFNRFAELCEILYDAEGLSSAPPQQPNTNDEIAIARWRDQVKFYAMRTSDPSLPSKVEYVLKFTLNQLRNNLPEHVVLSKTDFNKAIKDEAKPSLQIPLLDALANPAKAIDDLIAPFYLPMAYDHQLFLALRQRLTYNGNEASGIDNPATSKKKPILPTEYRGAPWEIADAYLKGTPFFDLLNTPVAFTIPQRARYEHTLILGPSRSGKTTLLERMILSDLAEDNPPAMVIIDPKGLMVERISKLALFNDRLKERLIILRPTDAPALTMFNAAWRWNQTYSDTIKRQIEQQAVSNMAYTFSSLDSALTQKQSVPFAFCARLMFEIDGATIKTLFNLLDDPARTYDQSTFKDYVERLDDISRHFFQKDYYSSTFGETRQQIKARLYSIMQRPEFVEMFSAPIRKFDMFQALQQRKIVLVDTQMGLLGSDSSSLFGRYLISLTLNAAFERIAIPKDQWHPAYLIIDEFPLFADEMKTPEMLRLAGEYNLGITMAVQDLHGKPFNEALRTSLSTNTSIKYASSPEAIDLSYAARDLRCDQEFLRAQTKTQTHARFACFVRGYLNRAVSIVIPFGAINNEPRMSDAAYVELLNHNQRVLTMQPDDRRPFHAQERREPIPDDDRHTAPAIKKKAQ